MSLSFKSAYMASSKTPNWFVNNLIGGILLCIPIVNLIVLGYFVSYAKRALIENDENLLPFSNVSEFFAKGCGAVIGSILLSIPFFMIAALGFIAIMPLSGSSFDFSSLMFSMFAFQALIILLSSFMGLLFIIMVSLYSISGKIVTMIDFQSALSLISKNKNTLLYIIYYILLCVIMTILCIILSITVIGILFIPMISYQITISLYNLTAQYLRSSENFGSVVAQLRA